MASIGLGRGPDFWVAAPSIEWYITQRTPSPNKPDVGHTHGGSGGRRKESGAGLCWGGRIEAGHDLPRPWRGSAGAPRWSFEELLANDLIDWRGAVRCRALMYVCMCLQGPPDGLNYGGNVARERPEHAMKMHRTMCGLTRASPRHPSIHPNRSVRAVRTSHRRGRWLEGRARRHRRRGVGRQVARASSETEAPGTYASVHGPRWWWSLPSHPSSAAGVGAGPAMKEEPYDTGSAGAASRPPAASAGAAVVAPSAADSSKRKAGAPSSHAPAAARQQQEHPQGQPQPQQGSRGRRRDHIAGAGALGVQLFRLEPPRVAPLLALVPESVMANLLGFLPGESISNFSTTCRAALPFLHCVPALILTNAPAFPSFARRLQQGEGVRHLASLAFERLEGMEDGLDDGGLEPLAKEQSALLQMVSEVVAAVLANAHKVGRRAGNGNAMR